MCREGRRGDRAGSRRLGLGHRQRGHELPRLDSTPRPDRRGSLRPEYGPGDDASGLSEPRLPRPLRPGRPRVDRAFDRAGRRHAAGAIGQLLDALLRRRAGLGRLLRPVLGDRQRDAFQARVWKTVRCHDVAWHQRRPALDGLFQRAQGDRSGDVCPPGGRPRAGGLRPGGASRLGPPGQRRDNAQAPPPPARRRAPGMGSRPGRGDGRSEAGQPPRGLRPRTNVPGRRARARRAVAGLRDRRSDDRGDSLRGLRDHRVEAQGPVAFRSNHEYRTGRRGGRLYSAAGAVPLRRLQYLARSERRPGDDRRAEDCRSLARADGTACQAPASCDAPDKRSLCRSGSGA